MKSERFLLRKNIIVNNDEHHNRMARSNFPDSFDKIDVERGYILNSAANNIMANGKDPPYCNTVDALLVHKQPLLKKQL